MKKIVITSGFFNPIHKGHINLIREAKDLGDFLIVLVNNDNQVKLKGSAPFMPQEERLEIVKALKYADQVMLAIDTDATVAQSLRQIAIEHAGELIFAKGGDRSFDNIPESEKKVCQELNITVVNNVGGGKVQSSSWLIKNASKPNMSASALRNAIIKLTALVPYKIKLAVYQYPAIASLLRKTINAGLASGEKISMTPINSGFLKGYKMGLDLQKEKSYWLGTWEPQVQQTIKDTVGEGMVVYDVGAHIGYFSLLFSKCAGKTGKVISFEPDPQNYGRLVQNCHANTITNITPINQAISDKKGTAFLDKTDGEFEGYLSDTANNGRNVIEVATQTLDNMVYQEHHLLPDVVKIDVEGAEGSVIKGMERILTEKKPVIICELHNPTASQEVLRILFANNYAFFDIENAMAPITDINTYQRGHVIAKPS